MIQTRTVGIVGAGSIGVAAAYAIFHSRVASDIVLVDTNVQRAEGEALDLMHGQALVGRTSVRAGSLRDLFRAQVIIISTGRWQVNGESRADFLARSAAMFRDIASELDVYAPEAILVIATEPVDALTWIMQELSARPPSRIIGTGTLLDTARFRSLLGVYYNVDPRSVLAYVVGEHGDAEVPLWSNAAIGGLPLYERTVLGRPWSREAMDGIFDQVRRAAFAIVERKGNASLAMGVVLNHLVEAIMSDQRSVLPVSVRVDGEYGISDVCLSVPCVIGSDGVAGRVLPVLLQEEHEALTRAAARFTEIRQGLQL